jgi:drug/metabolite transporter (DMT)-like permease
MEVIYAVVSGLIAMVCWGIANFFQAMQVRKMGTLKQMYISSIIGFVIAAIFYIIFIVAKIKLDMPLFALGLLGIFCLVNAIAVLSFLKSFEFGEISIVGPISSAYSLITAILAFIFLSEEITITRIISIIAIVAGIVLVSTDIKKIHNLHKVKGVKNAILSMLLWGIYFFMLGYISRYLVPYYMQTYALAEIDAKFIAGVNIFFFSSIFNNLFMVLIPILKNGLMDLSDLKDGFMAKTFLLNSVLFTVAWIAVTYGLANGLVSIVTPVSSLNPAITVVLAMIFLKEKIVFNQKIGLIFVFAGIFFISI